MNDKETKDHIFQHIEGSRKAINVEEYIRDEETSLDNSYIYATFDEYGTKIEEIDCE